MSSQNIAKNTTFYTTALATQKVLSFIYFIFVARAIGVDDMGKLTFALSFTTLFAIILDFGLNQVLIKESAKDSDSSQKYLSGIIGLKIIGATLVYGLVAVLINLMGYPELVIKMVYVSGVVMILDSFTLSFYGVLRGHQNLKFESLGTVINQLIVIAFGLMVLYFKLSLVYLISAYLAGAVFNFLFSFLALKYKLKISLIAKFDWSIFKKLLLVSLPFALAAIFVRFYSNIDIVLLSKMTNDYEVGLYSIAYKVAFALQFIGAATLASVYPAFCRYFIEDKKKLAVSFVKISKYLMILSLPLAVGVITIGDYIIGPVFGAEYANSVPALQLMMISIPLSFMSFPLGAMLNACNRQITNTVILGATALLSLILNLIFIPLWGYIGAALAVPISYSFLFIVSMIAVNKAVAYSRRELLSSLVKVLVSSIVMGVVVYSLKAQINFGPVIIIGIVVYVMLLFAIGGITKNDFITIKELIFKKK